MLKKRSIDWGDGRSNPGCILIWFREIPAHRGPAHHLVEPTHHPFKKEAQP